MAFDPISAGLTLGGGALGGWLSNEEHIGPGDLYPDWMKGLRRDLAGNIGDLDPRQVFQGQWTAPMSNDMQQSLQGMKAWGAPGGMGHRQMWDAYGAGRDALGFGRQHMADMAERGPNQFQYDQGTFDTIMGNLAPGVQNMFDVGARDIQQGYDFNVLPGLNMAAGMAGGYGGTKALQQSALGQAQTAGNIQNMGANLWQNAANAANQGGYGAGIANLGAANQYDNNMQGLLGLGANILGQSYDMGTNNLGLANQAAGYRDSFNQAKRDRSRSRWDMRENLPWQDQMDRLSMMKMYEMGSQPTTLGMNTMQGLNQGLQFGAGLSSIYENVFGNNNLFGGGGFNDYMNDVVNGDYDWSAII